MIFSIIGKPRNYGDSVVFNDGNPVNWQNRSSVPISIKVPISKSNYRYICAIYSEANPNAILYYSGDTMSVTTTNVVVGDYIIYTRIANVNVLADGLLHLTVTLTSPGGVADDTIEITAIKNTVAIQATISRLTASPTTSQDVEFTAVFSKTPFGVSANNFVTTNGTIGTITNVGTVYTIPVNGLQYGETATLTMVTDGITDIYGNYFANAPTYTNNSIVCSSPFVCNSITVVGGKTLTNSSTIEFLVAFSAPTYNFNSADVTLVAGAGASISGISNSDSTNYTVSVSGMTESGQDIQITIPNTAEITNTIGLPITGLPISSPVVTWDNVAPTLVSTNPIAGTTGIATTGTRTLTMTLSEDVVIGTSGSIELRKVSDGQIIESFNYDSPAISINGNVVTITSVAELPSYTNIYLTLSLGIFKDNAGNSLAGIISTTTWYFKTAITTPTAQVTNITGTQTKSTISLTVTKPSGTRIIVLAKSGTSTVSPPSTDYNTLNFANLLGIANDYESVDSLIYTNSGSAFGSTGYKVVFAGDASIESATSKAFTVSGLSGGTNYRFFAYAYNKDESGCYYNTAISPFTRVFKTNTY